MFEHLLIEARKGLAALAGAAAEAVTLGLLHGDAQRWVTGGVAVATTLVVYLLPNDEIGEEPPAGLAAQDPTAPANDDPTVAAQAGAPQS